MRKEWSFLPLAAPLTLLVAGCGDRVAMPPTLDQLTPASAYSDGPVKLVLNGQDFRPPVDLDTQSGAAGVIAVPFRVALDPVRPTADRRPLDGIDPTWVSSNEVDASLPAGLPAGDYVVNLLDAAGQLIPRALRYTSLGSDLDPPHITFLQPTALSVVQPGETVVVQALIDDGAGHAQEGDATVSSPNYGPVTQACDPDGQGYCTFEFMAPTPHTALEPINISLHAQDSLNNTATSFLTIYVAAVPSITSVSPAEGTTGGGTEITVSGNSFVSGVSQIEIDDVPTKYLDGDDVVGVGGNTIRGTTPAHIPGIFKLIVRTGDSVSNPLTFSFIAPPILKLVDPSHAPAAPLTEIRIAGDNFRAQTQFFWVQYGVRHAIPWAPDADPSRPAPFETVLTEFRANLYLQPGAGTISLLAHDDVAGDSMLVNAFTFDPAP